MTRPLLFSLLIILASFLPIFFLGDREGRLFDPLAYSKTSAMAFSTLLTLFLLPIIIVWVFKANNPQPRGSRDSRFVRGYRSALRTVIRFRYAAVGASAALLIAAAILMSGFQRDYMPEMEEGSILYMPTTLPGMPSREAGWMLQQMDRKLKEFPEVARVFGKLGRADTSTDPAPMMMTEATILLKPTTEWRPGLTKERLIAEMDAAMQHRRLRQRVDAADRRTYRDAGHRHPDPRRNQGEGAGCGRHRGHFPPDRGAARRVSGHRIGDCGADLAGFLRGHRERSRAARGQRSDGGRGDVDGALRDRRRQRRDRAATGRHDRAVQHPIRSGVYRYAGKDPRRARHHGRRQAGCP